MTESSSITSEVFVGWCRHNRMVAGCVDGDYDGLDEDVLGMLRRGLVVELRQSATLQGCEVCARV